MGDRHGRHAQRGVALIMSLIFLLLLAIVAAALVETLATQNRLGVAHQQARSLFQSLQGVLDEASREQTELRAQAQLAKPGTSQVWQGDKPTLPAGSGLQFEMLRAAYGCLVPGYSNGSCLPLELEASGARGAAAVNARQVLGLRVETVDVTSGGDSRAGIF
ncbi:PilX N-terminal domain-containing pilus assembly protein [Salinicola endophyticus]|uniref:PilX N-terminal domain-containing pilus assembly protein n=1 Tax=Salinicola endophyticus TaxID=1949083 RepID=UPI000DA1A1AC|nr:PilX N-terminal domain-containing pilus assembly protein [Salinicola endophyticus]